MAKSDRESEAAEETSCADWEEWPRVWAILSHIAHTEVYQLKYDSVHKRFDPNQEQAMCTHSLVWNGAH